MPWSDESSDAHRGHDFRHLLTICGKGVHFGFTACMHVSRLPLMALPLAWISQRLSARPHLLDLGLYRPAPRSNVLQRGLIARCFGWAVLLIFSCLCTAYAVAQPGRKPLLEGTAPGRSESGYPQFAIRSHESIGLATVPTDMTLLKDGRVLLFAGRQIAMGDGTRWDVFTQADDDASVPSSDVALDQDGTLYIGFSGGFGRIVFDDEGRWRIQVAERWTGEEAGHFPLLRKVVQVEDDWYWHGDSGPVVRWKPGTRPKIVARLSTIAALFSIGGQHYVSDRSDASLVRINEEGNEVISLNEQGGFDTIIDSAVSLGNEEALVGLHLRGVSVFDGKSFTPIARAGLLSTGSRVQSLVRTDEGFFAAAIQDRGIVFFTREGKVVQFLSREVDHRLGRARHLIPTQGGIIYALLEDGFGMINFPSPASSFEALLGRAVSFTLPFRVAGDLWMETDGFLLRGNYDAAGTLLNFTPDQPGTSFIFAVSPVDNTVIVSNSNTTYIRRGTYWVPLFSNVSNFRILTGEMNGRWLYSAKGQIGWMTRSEGSYALAPTPAPGLGHVYSARLDGNGNVWLELGSGKVGRIVVSPEGVPQFKEYGAHQGVPDGWAQVFELDAEVAFNVADQILKYSEASDRLEPAPELAARFKGAGRIIGRPAMDPKGRVWLGDEQGPSLWSRQGDSWFRQSLAATIRFMPHMYTIQSDGVVWMEANGRHVRYDPAMPAAEPPPIRAVVTHVELPATRRIVFNRNGVHPEFSFEENSLAAHFAAVGGVPFAPVTFDVQLGTEAGDWTPVGPSGLASFSNLKEGKYSLRVRPRIGDELGSESVFDFSIRPPWYRTPLAYLAYFLCTLGIVTLVAWSASFLQRRENLRLEELVARRTSELNESNAKLERQVEEIRRLSLAIEQSPVGVAIVRKTGTIVFANPRFCDLFGYRHDEVLGREISSLRLQPFTPSLNVQVQRTIEAGEAWHGQLTNQAKDGHAVHVRTTIAPIRSPDGEIRSHLILEEDISEWLEEQDRRHRLESQLLQAQKLEALGTLAGGIAHDFNNILTGILGYCELSALDMDAPDRLSLHLSEIKGAGMRAKDLVARILTFSRQSTPTLAPMDLAHAVGEALKLLRASTPATIEYHIRIAPASVMGDATQIHQVVVNLCTNAVHAMQGKPGRISVEVESLVLSPEEAAELHDIKSGHVAKLTVSDTGHGMDSATLGRIFDPFFTTKQPGHGTGLGLAIVRAIVANHNGAIRVKSTPGMGTTFELFFPSTDRAATASPFGELIAEGDGQRILVVDDEATIANFIANRLRRLGYEVDVFNEPRVALDRFLADPYRYTAIVTDLTMPGMTGLQLLQAARERKVVPAVIVSGYGVELGSTDPASLTRCLLLPKPFNGNDLARAIQQVLADE
ncbi:MAG: ATP-binding protein [Opitutaceae bacterium]|nr:ATP-binding protein [Opitutaceae bacterium]